VVSLEDALVKDVGVLRVGAGEPPHGQVLRLLVLVLVAAVNPPATAADQEDAEEQNRAGNDQPKRQTLAEKLKLAFRLAGLGSEG